MTKETKWMRHAFALAQTAKEHNEVPVGAIIVYEDKIIGEGWNQPNATHDPTSHAEIIALRNAGKTMHNYRLPGTAMYVTLEPCVMCAGAMVHARVAELIYAVADPKTGACGSVFHILQAKELNHRVEIRKGVM